ncbi:MAG: hypothetical protein GY794_09240 [bacterium]|nr:hypothetical protein [bacterium]
MNQKRSIRVAVAVVVVIAVVIVVLCVRGCGGDKKQPIVIEVLIHASDNLAMSINVDSDIVLADRMFIGSDAESQLLMGPDLIAAIKKGVGDQSVEMPEGITALEDIGAVIIERITYEGQGRRSEVKRIRLTANVPDPPQRKTPDKVVIGLDGSYASLYDVLPWPEGISWTLIDDDKLKVVSGKTTLELAVGESKTLGSTVAEIPVSIEEVDDTADIPDGEDVKLPTVQRDLGKVTFSTKISIRYLGRLKIEEDKQ